MKMWVRQQRLRTTLRQYWAQHQVVYERRQLVDRPWLEEVLHWSPDGQLHGHLSPPPSGRPQSVTSDGWCPGQR